MPLFGVVAAGFFSVSPGFVFGGGVAIGFCVGVAGVGSGVGCVAVLEAGGFGVGAAFAGAFVPGQGNISPEGIFIHCPVAGLIV